MNGNLAARIVVALFLLLAAGFGALAVRTATTQAELAERTRALETRQASTDEGLREMKAKVETIYQWVLRQQGARERAGTAREWP